MAVKNKRFSVILCFDLENILFAFIVAILFEIKDNCFHTFLEINGTIYLYIASTRKRHKIETSKSV